VKLYAILRTISSNYVPGTPCSDRGVLWLRGSLIRVIWL